MDTVVAPVCGRRMVMVVRAAGLLVLSMMALAACGAPEAPRFDRTRIPLSEDADARNTVAGDQGQNSPRPNGCASTGIDCSADAGVVCVPTTCAAVGATCGEAPDGCGAVMNCGDCEGGAVCTDNACTGAIQ